MNKKDKEIEYQKGLTELYEETQEMGRGDFVKMIYDLKEELDIANKKLDKIKELSKKIKGSYDYSVWIDLKSYWDTLESFNKNIATNLHPIITTAFQQDIKNSINKTIEYARYEVVKKDDILSIIGGD